jgi:hypothetical protein
MHARTTQKHGWYMQIADAILLCKILNFDVKNAVEHYREHGA